MAARQPEDANQRYLVSCVACGASNPVNASTCWHCEQDLPTKPQATGPRAPPSATEENDPAHAAPASYFPVLRDEASGQAANDEAGRDTVSPFLAGQDAVAGDVAPRGPTRRRGIIGAAAVVAAAVLALVLMGRGEADRPVGRPLPLDAAQTAPTGAGPAAVSGPATGVAVPLSSPGALGLPAAPSADVTAAHLPKPSTSAQTAARPSRPGGAATRAPPRGRGDVALPDAAPPSTVSPVKAPCTPNVEALGLCSTGSH